jgi:transposase
MAPRALATTSKQACTSAAPAAPVRVLPHDFVVSWSATHKRFLRWTSDGTWDRALAELHHPGPLCPRPQPGALSRSDRLLLNQSVTRSWSSRLRRRQEDRRHQTPHRRGHPGPAGGRAGHRGQRAGSGGAAPAARPSRYRCPRLGICGPTRAHRQRRAGREQDPAVHDPDRRRDQAQGGFITQPRRWVVERTFACMHRCRRLTRQYSRPHWPMRPWSSSASSRSCSAA